MRFFLFCATLLLAAAMPAFASASPAEKQIFDQVNQERQNAGLAALEWNDRVAEAARSHAEALSQNNELSHQYPGEPTLPERLAATGIRFTQAAENVAKTDHLEDVHLSLMNSPGHRANMLNPGYNAAGVGVVERAGIIYVAQDFIFLVPMYSEAEFSAALAQSINQARRAKRIGEIDARPVFFLREVACSTDGDVHKLAGKVSGRLVAVFTSSDPRRLPEQVLKIAVNADYHRMNFNVCFRPDQQHGNANFFVVAVFQGD
jgi:Cysteine-rich secretory protein family